MTIPEKPSSENQKCIFTAFLVEYQYHYNILESEIL